MNFKQVKMEFWSVGVMEYWSVGVLEYWSNGVLEYWSVGVLGITHIFIFIFPSFHLSTSYTPIYLEITSR